MAIGTAVGRAILQEWIVQQNQGEVTIGLHTGAPGPDGTQNEVQGGSYARVPAPSWQLHASAASVSLVGSLDIAGMPSVGGSGVTHASVWCGETYFGDIDLNDATVEAGETARLTNLVLAFQTS